MDWVAMCHVVLNLDPDIMGGCGRMLWRVVIQNLNS